MPTLLADGMVVGLWRRAKGGQRVGLLVEPTRRLSAAERAALAAEAHRIGAFLGAEPELQVGSLDA